MFDCNCIHLICAPLKALPVVRSVTQCAAVNPSPEPCQRYREID